MSTTRTRLRFLMSVLWLTGLTLGQASAQSVLRVSVAPHPAFDPSLRLLKATLHLAKDGSEFLALETPANPGIGGTLEVKVIEPICQPVKQVVFGSLTYLAFDGTAVLYNRAYSLESGFEGRIWTNVGASMDVDPESINLRSHGRFVTAPIKVANNGAAQINVAALTISVDGVAGSVPVAETRLEDVDGDLNHDLVARFDRQTLHALLQQTTGRTAILRTAWQFLNGGEGQASAQVRVGR